MDLSMCLMSPSRLQDGWTGVADLGFWIDQATRWFDGYASQGWAVQQGEWLMMAPWLPAPEYRPALPPTLFIAVPHAWHEVGFAPYGTFRARLPRERRGMGAVTSWRSGAGRAQRWNAAAALVEGEYDDIEGSWISMEASQSGQAGPPRAVHRRIARGMMRSVTRGKPLLNASFTDMFTDIGERIWMFSQDPFSVVRQLAEADDPRLPVPERLRRQQATIQRFLPWPGICLDRPRLEARRVIGKGRKMLDLISSAHVMIVGLGALGSEVAHLLAREGIAHFTLVDGDMLLPENIARHRADLAEAGRPKVEAMQRDILRVNPAAKVAPVVSWIDDLVPSAGWRTARPSLALGLTGHEGSEHVLGDRCTELDMACLHAWLEVDGTVLRLFRALPGRDPTLLDLARSPETSIPYLPRRSTSGALECADNVLPGSAVNIHAAANFVARAALDVITGQVSAENHWLFAPDGLSDADSRVPAALATRYGVVSFSLPRPAA
jgi:hypothetical protein